MNKPRLVFICRASSSVGMGHLMRSGAVARVAMAQADVRLLVIGDRAAQTLLDGSGVPGAVCADEHEATDRAIALRPDAVVLDMTHLSVGCFHKLEGVPVASLSPVFDRLDRCDLFFHRTMHHPLAHLAVDRPGWKLGLAYAVVRPACVPIPTDRYEDSIAEGHRLPVAICMGGGDAGNKTLRVIERLGQIEEPMTFWVLLGEGYGHSHDELFDTARRASQQSSMHEMILARTTDSMWRVLRSCAVGVFAAGTVTYEAVAAGLPSINLFDDDAQRYLVREPVEKHAALDAGADFDAALDRTAGILSYLNRSRNDLLQVHRACAKLIDGKASSRIVSAMVETIEQGNAAADGGLRAETRDAV